MQGGFNTLDNFLFIGNDFASPSQSKLFNRLYQINKPSLNYYLDNLKLFCVGDIQAIKKPVLHSIEQNKTLIAKNDIIPETVERNKIIVNEINELENTVETSQVRSNTFNRNENAKILKAYLSKEQGEVSLDKTIWQNNDPESESIVIPEKENNKHRKTSSSGKIFYFCFFVIIAILLILITTFYFNKNDSSDPLRPSEVETMNPSMQNSAQHIDYTETIKQFIEAEDSQDFYRISPFFSNSIIRFWEKKFPTKNQIQDLYTSSWGKTLNSKNYIKKITKLHDVAYEVDVLFNYSNKSDNEPKSVLSKLFIQFDGIGKINSIYPISTQNLVRVQNENFVSKDWKANNYIDVYENYNLENKIGHILQGGKLEVLYSEFLFYETKEVRITKLFPPDFSSCEISDFKIGDVLKILIYEDHGYWKVQHNGKIKYANFKYDSSGDRVLQSGYDCCNSIEGRVIKNTEQFVFWARVKTENNIEGWVKIEDSSILDSMAIITY